MKRMTDYWAEELSAKGKAERLKHAELIAKKQVCALVNRTRKLMREWNECDANGGETKHYRQCAKCGLVKKKSEFSEDDERGWCKECADKAYQALLKKRKALRTGRL